MSIKYELDHVDKAEHHIEEPHRKAVPMHGLDMTAAELRLVSVV